MIEARALVRDQGTCLGQYLGEWLSHAHGRVRVSTYEGYESLIRLYLLRGVARHEDSSRPTPPKWGNITDSTKPGEHQSFNETQALQSADSQGAPQRCGSTPKESGGISRYLPAGSGFCRAASEDALPGIRREEERL